ncbi:MAG: restriction endonuclease subunit S [Akkermansia muciniphila]
MLDYCFTTPRTFIEQSAIGRFFCKVDALISQQQKKVEKLQGLKKGLMKKMFPRGGCTLPEVRFAGFDGEWVESRFPDLFVYLKNNTLSRACQADEGSDVQNIHYGDVLVKYSNCVDPESDRIPHILKEKLSESIQSCFLTNGDIIIADTAEDTTAGKCCELLLHTDRKIVSGLHTIPCRPVRQFGCGFLGYYLNSESYRIQLYPLMQGIKVISISRGSLQTTEVCFPDSTTEQSTIGRLFRKLDDLITLHGEKLEKLRHVKQALLGKMFV